MLNRRLQVLIDEGRWRLLEAEAERRSVSVAVLVRDAIDQRYGGVSLAEKQEAWEWLEAQAKVPAPTLNEIRAVLWEQATGPIDP